MKWVVWGVLICLQNALFTLTSRARNSNNIYAHAIVIPIAQCVYILCSLFALDNGLKVIQQGNYRAGLAQLCLYICCTSIGSLSAHWLALHGKRYSKSLRTLLRGEPRKASKELA